MSRPAFRPRWQRTVACPTCLAPKGHPCQRLGDDTHGVGQSVSVHAARRVLEAQERQRRQATPPARYQPRGTRP